MIVLPTNFFFFVAQWMTTSEYPKRCALIMEDNEEFCGKVVASEPKPDEITLLRMQTRCYNRNRFEVVEDPLKSNSEGFSTSLEGPMIPIKTGFKLTVVVCAYL